MSKKNSSFLVQITASPSQLLIANSSGGGLFSFSEQKSASKALQTWYFVYFLGQWGGARAPPGYATDSHRGHVPTSLDKALYDDYLC